MAKRETKAEFKARVDLYKTDIKRWIAAMRDDTEWIEQMSRRSGGKVSAADITEKLDRS